MEIRDVHTSRGHISLMFFLSLLFVYGGQEREIL